jgi:hypothetical protein
MNSQALEKIKQSIEDWNGRKYYTYQTKTFLVSKSPINPDEYILRFTTSVQSFFCNGELIKMDLGSKMFHSTTLGDNPVSDNENADKFRLDKFLIDFDDQFNELVEEKLSECSETSFTSDPLFF